jgi:hypothetical protein
MRGENNLEMEDFVTAVLLPNKDFRRFLREVSMQAPDGELEVLYEEFFPVLKLLWTLYNIVKEMGWFQRFFATRAVRAALRDNEYPESQEQALIAIADRYK